MLSINYRVGKRGPPRVGSLIAGRLISQRAARLYTHLEADTAASNSELAGVLGISRRAVQYAIRELERAGLVETAYTRLGRSIKPLRTTAPGVSPLAGTATSVRPRRRTGDTL